MNPIAISVVIPVFNTECYLSTCLDSVLNQTLENIEVICIDDGSTDNSLEILKKYQKKDNRVKIISKDNEGQGVARNIGISEAIGEYIAFVDSDDFIKKTQYTYYTKDALKKVANDVAYFAEKEGLTAHAKSATIRFI